MDPPYTGLIGFKLSMVVPDLLHVWNLGVARDLTGSILKTLLKDAHVFAGSNVEERLQNATVSLKAFAKSEALPLRMKKLTKKN